MTDWAKQQRECTVCRGWGFTRSADGKSATRCKCQPWTMDELAEAARQEADVQSSVKLS